MEGLNSQAIKIYQLFEEGRLGEVRDFFDKSDSAHKILMGLILHSNEQRQAEAGLLMTLKLKLEMQEGNLNEIENFMLLIVNGIKASGREIDKNIAIQMLECRESILIFISENHWEQLGSSAADEIYHLVVEMHPEFGPLSHRIEVSRTRKGGHPDGNS